MVLGWIGFFSNELCVFYPRALGGDRKYSTSWIKITSQPKPWGFLFIRYSLIFYYCFIYFKHFYQRFKPNNTPNVCKQYYVIVYSELKPKVYFYT